ARVVWVGLSRLVAEEPGDRGELVVLGGEGVAWTAADQHDGVPDAGRETPGAAQRGGVRCLDQAAAGRRVQGRQGPGGAQPVNGVAPVQLEELDGPLHVRKAAGAE